MSLKILGSMLLAGAAVACAGPSAESAATGTGSVAESALQSASAVTPAKLMRVTPILAVEAIEPVLPFWKALGFTVINPARRNGTLIFIGLVKDDLEIHYQTRAHIQTTMPAAVNLLENSTALVFLTVDDLDPVVAGLGNAEVLIARRRTEWGSDEIYVKEPGGNIVGFAAFGG